MQKVDPPAQVIDAFRDVQAARADLERAQNEAQTYANRVVPEARGKAAQITQAAEAYREQTVAEANGQASRFTQGLRGIQEGARGHPPAHVSRNHGARARRHRQDHPRFQPASGANGGVSCPILPLNELLRRTTRTTGGTAMKLGIAGGVVAVLAVVVAIIAYGSLFTVYQTQQALVVRLGQPVRVVTEPGLQLQVAADRQRDRDRQAHPRPGERRRRK